ncbi:MAG TPA: DNA helicase RecG, partial [Clostridia bacterium]|nr:DNA helicase RecG [Clostridia bacterium]
MFINELTQDIRYLKGVGPARAEAFMNLGIETYGDLLEFFPRTYEDRSVVRKINEIEDGESATVTVKIISSDFRRIRENLSILKIVAQDDSGYISIVFFN